MRAVIRISALALAAFGLVTVSQAAIVVESEPNNSFGTPQLIGPESFTLDLNPNIVNSTTLPHATVLGTGDGSFDYYSFTTIAPSIIQIDVDSSPVFTNFDIEVDLWNAAGTFLAGNDDGGLDAGDDGTNLVGGAFNSRFSTGVLPAGTYLVGVSTFPSSGLNGGGISGNGATGNYTLHISAIANPEPATILLFGLGAMVAGGYEVRRRRKVA